jgi:hypothetical protein
MTVIAGKKASRPQGLPKRRKLTKSGKENGD